MFCQECGGRLMGNAKFCSNCGAKLTDIDGTLEKTHISGQQADFKASASEPKPAVLPQTGTSDQDIIQSSDETGDTPAVFDLDLTEMKTTSDLRLLLVGHTGHGKSATGNTLLGREEFLHKRSTNSVTQRTSRKVVRRFGRNIEVVDTPGFCDTSHEDLFVESELIRCIGLTIPGFNAIVFVLSPQARFTKEIIQTVDHFFRFFGKNVDDFAFVLLTHTSKTTDQESYLEGSHLKLDEMIKRCKGKVLKIDNSADMILKQQFARDIFEAIDVANANINEPYFTNAMIEHVDWFAFRWWEKVYRRYRGPLINEYTCLSEEQQKREAFKTRLEKEETFLDSLVSSVRESVRTARSKCVLL